MSLTPFVSVAVQQTAPCNCGCRDDPVASRPIVPIQLAGNGKVTGVVSFDGSALPGATIELESPPVHFTQVTDVNGRFAFFNVPPGESYRLYAELVGLKTVRKKNVNVIAGRTTDLSLRMRIDPLEMICVDCGTPIPQLPDGPSFTITRDMIDALPIR